MLERCANEYEFRNRGETVLSFRFKMANYRRVTMGFVYQRSDVFNVVFIGGRSTDNDVTSGITVKGIPSIADFKDHII